MSKLDRIHFLPWWMNTFWGRWLSEHWRPAVALRSALTDNSDYLLAKYWAQRNAEKALRSVGACIQSNFNEEFRRRLIEDFDNWLKSSAAEERAAMMLSRRQ